MNDTSQGFRSQWATRGSLFSSSRRLAVVALLLTALPLGGFGCGSTEGAAPAPTPTATVPPLDGYSTCSGSQLALCSTCVGTTNGCCTLSTPGGCFDPSVGPIYTGCNTDHSKACVMPTPDPPAQVEITNQTTSPISVYLLLYNQPAGDWSFCSTVDNYCQFTLAGSSTRSLPSGGYLNFAASFGAEGYACQAPTGATIAEVNVNNPSWKDQLDISLVNGYNAKVEIVATPFGNAANQVTLGPPNGMNDNQNVFGVYPYGCDVCVARCCPGCPNPPLSMTQSNPLMCTVLDPVCTNQDTHCDSCTGNGTDGCKTGTQSNPSEPCQYQGINTGGDGGSVQVIFMGT